MKTTKDILKLLKNTGRTLFVDEKIAKSAPQGKGELEFFKVDKFITEDELEKEYESRGLSPAPLNLLCEYSQGKLDQMTWVATHWKNAEQNWCFATFSGWRDERGVGVDRSDGGWDDHWWFGGVSKSSPKSSVPKNSLDTLSLTLENAIEVVKKEGYVIYKPI